MQTRNKIAAAVLALSATALTGCSADLPAPGDLLDEIQESSAATADAAAGSGTIDTTATRNALDTIPVTEETDADYDRDRDYGDGWAYTGDGCDVRDQVMLRDMRDYTLREDGCSVETGVLDDPYTGTTIDFEFGREPGKSDAVQIDHLIPLSEAHASGAADWTQDERETFANDTQNLLASDGPANNAKGNKDAAEWLPDNGAYQCQYVAGQIEVKSTYGLTVDQAEHDALAAVLDQC